MWHVAHAVGGKREQTSQFKGGSSREFLRNGQTQSVGVGSSPIARAVPYSRNNSPLIDLELVHHAVHPSSPARSARMEQPESAYLHSATVCALTHDG